MLLIRTIDCHSFYAIFRYSCFSGLDSNLPKIDLTLPKIRCLKCYRKSEIIWQKSWSFVPRFVFQNRPIQACVPYKRACSPHIFGIHIYLESNPVVCSCQSHHIIRRVCAIIFTPTSCIPTVHSSLFLPFEILFIVYSWPAMVYSSNFCQYALLVHIEFSDY